MTSALGAKVRQGLEQNGPAYQLTRDLDDPPRPIPRRLEAIGMIFERHDVTEARLNSQFGVYGLRSNRKAPQRGIIDVPGEKLLKNVEEMRECWATPCVRKAGRRLIPHRGTKDRMSQGSLENRIHFAQSGMLRTL